jgi:RimJ/RimL family protein N-acetyltransferase
VDAPGYRIDWDTDVGHLAALEPTLGEVAAHAAVLAAGYNEPVNARLMGHTAPISETEVVDHYEAMLEEGMRAFLLFRDGALVGDADLRGFDGGAAEFAFMIGARDQQGKGLGTRFATMVLAFGFSHLGLHHVYASVVPENTASRRVFDKLGLVLDDSSAARAFADEPGDITMSIDRETFDRLHVPELGQLRIGLR